MYDMINYGRDGAFKPNEENIKMARNQIVKKSLDVSNATVTFTFVGEGAKLILTPIVVDAKTMPPAIRAHAELHGYSQKFGDALAKGKDEPLSDAIERFKTTLAQAKAGQWRAESTFERAPRDFIVAFQMYLETQAKTKRKVTVEQAAQLLEKLGEEKVKAFKSMPWTKSAVANIRAKRAADAAKEAKPIDLGL